MIIQMPKNQPFNINEILAEIELQIKLLKN